MAVKKATTTDDLTKSAENPEPTRDELVAQVEEATSQDMVAKADSVKYQKVTSPAGSTVEVPEGIVDALVQSGYSKSK